MVSAHNFSEWKDFPKGLHVMVVDKDNALLSHLKSKLEALDYTVTTFSNEDDAMAALHTHSYHFHVILAEAPVDAGVDNFKVLQSAQNVPIIMMSDTENMAVMIQSIALGASDFLQKPIADEKLKIIWHHVARKAMSTGKVRLPVSSIDVHQSEEKQDVSPTKYLPSLTEAEEENRKESILIAPCEIFFAQGTSQLEQKRRIILPLDSCRDSSRSDDICCVKIEVDDIEDTFTLSDSSEKVKTEACGTLDKSSYSCSDVSGHDRFQQSEFNCVFQLDDNLDDLILFSDLIIGNDEMSIDYLHEKLDWNEVDEAEEEALLLAEVAKAEKERFLITESNPDKEQQKKADISRDCIRKMSKICGAGRRKMKVEWTPELHRRFVEAVEQLGVEKAIPSKILELMGVQCLTRHNIASHLQKYRSHRKHISVREAEGMNWNNRRNLDATIVARARREGSTLCLSSSHRNTPPIQPRPCPGFMPVHIGPPLHVWGHPTLESMDRWQKSHVTAVAAAAWQAPDGTFWQHPATFTDAWIHPMPVPGTPCYPHPIMRLPLAPIPEVVDMAVPTTLRDYVHGNMTAILFEAEAGKNTNFQQPKETVDVAITEVLKDPWTPLPLGLKPPSLDSVMLELQKQGLAVVATDLPSSAT